MNREFEVTETLGVNGRRFPMSVVGTKQATGGLSDGDVLGALATDEGLVDLSVERSVDRQARQRSRDPMDDDVGDGVLRAADGGSPPPVAGRPDSLLLWC